MLLGRFFFSSVLNLHWPALRDWLQMKLAFLPTIVTESECRLLQRLSASFETRPTDYHWFRIIICATTQRTSARLAQFETNELQANKYRSVTHYNRHKNTTNQEQLWKRKNKNRECDPRCQHGSWAAHVSKTKRFLGFKWGFCIIWNKIFDGADDVMFQPGYRRKDEQLPWADAFHSCWVMSMTCRISIAKLVDRKLLLHQRATIPLVTCTNLY